MILINIDKLCADQRARENKKPEIKVLSVVLENPEVAKMPEKPRPPVPLQEALLYDLDNQERDLRRARAMKSNEYLPMIAREASQTEMSAHYALIESVSDDIRVLYDKRAHVRKYGRLPDQGTAETALNNSGLLALKDRKRSLENRRCKLKKKLELGQAKNSNRITEWAVEKDRLDLEYNIVQDKINELRHG